MILRRVIDDLMLPNGIPKRLFFYRLLTESLRIETIDNILKMRSFIDDLHNQLAQLQTSFIQSLNGQKDLTLYRGETMKLNQLNELRENRNGFVSMNSFMSATQDESIARVFSGDGIRTNPNEVSVIYEMMIDTDIFSRPYAKIESIILDEHEILFSMASVFRIEEVDELHDRVFRVKLRMVIVFVYLFYLSSLKHKKYVEYRNVSIFSLSTFVHFVIFTLNICSFDNLICRKA
jgi:hypothetical protein